MPSNLSKELSHSSPPPPTTPPPDNKTCSRNYLKCYQCRKDRKLCLRDPFDPSQKCARCKELGHQCGPSLKATRKKRAPAPSENMNMSSSINTSPNTLATIKTQLSDQTITTWRGADFGRVSHEVAVNIALLRLFQRARFDLDNCMAFEGVASHTHILPTQSHHFCQDLQSRISDQTDSLRVNQLYGIDASRSLDNTQSVDSTSGEFIALICTANVLKPCRPVRLQHHGHIRNSVNELPQSYYLSAEADLKAYLSSMSHESSDQRQTLHFQNIDDHGPFPACHLAYLNLDRENAYRLWESTIKKGTVVDILGRSFPHIVAEAGDSNLLDRMNAGVLKAAGCDGRGLSLLDLGVIGDSPLIVRTVIESNIVLPPFTRQMQRAIIGRRLEIAGHLLPHLAYTPWNDEHELNTLAGLAGRYGFRKLELELGAVVLAEPGPQNVLTFLDALGPQLPSDDLVIPENASFDSLDVPDWMLSPDLGDNQYFFDNSEYDSPHSSQADPGGSTRTFSYWPPYPPS